MERYVLFGAAVGAGMDAKLLTETSPRVEIEQLEQVDNRGDL